MTAGISCVLARDTRSIMYVANGLLTCIPERMLLLSVFVSVFVFMRGGGGDSGAFLMAEALRH